MKRIKFVFGSTIPTGDGSPSFKKGLWEFEGKARKAALRQERDALCILHALQQKISGTCLTQNCFPAREST